MQVDDAEAAVYKNAFAFAAVAYADDAVQATITRYAEKDRTLTAAIEAAEAEIDAAAQARKVVDASMNVTNAREAALKASMTASATGAAKRYAPP